MKAVSGKRLAKLAEQKGWVLSRINGSHHMPFDHFKQVDPTSAILDSGRIHGRR
jgi:predicted RNA binding protein YcfA (HicA-like mRNA interferase family)